MRGAFSSFLVLLLLLFAVAPGLARADAGDEARARALYEKGMAHFQLDEYDAAITLWLEAYRFKPVPELLYNVAQAHRLKAERALAFYRKYLALNPHAANRAEVERHIGSLEQLLSEAPPKVPQPASAPQPASVTPPPVPVKLPMKVAPPAKVAIAPVPAPAPAALIARAPAKSSIVKKPWFWGTLGTVAVVVGVSVGLGVGSAHSSDPAANFGIARGN